MKKSTGWLYLQATALALLSVGLLTLPLVPWGAVMTFVLLVLQLMGKIDIAWAWVWVPVGLPLAVSTLSMVAMVLLKRAYPSIYERPKRAKP